MRTLPNLKNNLLGLFIVMCFYAIIGLQLFKGALEFRCRLTEEPDQNGDWNYDPNQRYLCGVQTCDSGTYCGAPAEKNLPYNI